ncbi:MAG: AAA family ATPase [Deltaproteobacteria bacterium]|nr:AAA family ATPase [Deltaproteobacteria bacterium]
MERDRIVELEIHGLRCLQAVCLPIGGLTVLIGENGAGKSSVIEALEILRRAGTDQNFIEAFHLHHGGLNELLEVGAPELRLTIRVDGPDGSLRAARP